MINITNKVDCCGCNACGDICPKDAIRFETDIEGFWYPKVDRDKCIDCGLCEKTCPVINIGTLKHNDLPQSVCYAAEHKNLEVVFVGDMAFIGPRPERKFYIDQIIEHDRRYVCLYRIRSGVTSYATLHNGYTDTMDKMLKRLEYDFYYLEHVSLWLDFRILTGTFVSIAFGKKF